MKGKGRQTMPCHLLKVAVYNCDPRLIQWCKTTFGCGWVGVKQPKTKPTNRVGYKWEISGRKAEAILEQCFPFFLIKREQAEIGLAFQATMKRRQQRRISPLLLAERDSLKVQLSALKHMEFPSVHVA
jgi:hypothetical protein